MVDVGPGDAGADELLEEERRGDSAGERRVGRVRQVRDLAFDLLR
jgi:hypothetical protein